MGYAKDYGALLEAIAHEADAIAMRYFRADELRVDRKGDGTAVTQADRAVGEMARAKVAGRGVAPEGFGGEMGGRGGEVPGPSRRARVLIGTVECTGKFSRRD